MSIDYKQLKKLVLQELGGDGPGGSMGPSAPAVSHRMPAAEPPDKEQDMGDPEANEKYDIALTAREAAEKLVEALDQPIFDAAYEHAFKASACLMKALQCIEEAGAHPMPDQRVVPPPPNQQRYGSFASQNGAASYYGDSAGMIGLGALQESEHGGSEPEDTTGDEAP